MSNSSAPKSVRPAIWLAIGCAAISALMFSAQNEDELGKFVAGSIFAGTSLAFVVQAKNASDEGLPWK